MVSYGVVPASVGAGTTAGADAGSLVPGGALLLDDLELHAPVLLPARVGVVVGDRLVLAVALGGEAAVDDAALSAPSAPPRPAPARACLRFWAPRSSVWPCTSMRVISGCSLNTPATLSSSSSLTFLMVALPVSNCTCSRMRSPCRSHAPTWGSRSSSGPDRGALLAGHASSSSRMPSPSVSPRAAVGRGIAGPDPFDVGAGVLVVGDAVAVAIGRQRAAVLLRSSLEGRARRGRRRRRRGCRRVAVGRGSRSSSGRRAAAGHVGAGVVVVGDAVPIASAAGSRSCGVRTGRRRARRGRRRPGRGCRRGRCLASLSRRPPAHRRG